jgi:hypothetical protein
VTPSSGVIEYSSTPKSAGSPREAAGNPESPGNGFPTGADEAAALEGTCQMHREAAAYTRAYYTHTTHTIHATHVVTYCTPWP